MQRMAYSPLLVFKRQLQAQLFFLYPGVSWKHRSGHCSQAQALQWNQGTLHPLSTNSLAQSYINEGGSLWV